MKKKTEKTTGDAHQQEARRRIARIVEALSALEVVCSGTLLERRKVCGKPNCRCAQDPEQRHGPYYEWTRRHNGKLLHRVVTPQQARLIRRAIKNHQKILELLRQWEAETVHLIESIKGGKR